MEPNKTRTEYEIRNRGGVPVATHEHVKDRKTGDKDCFWRQPNGKPGLNGTRLADLPLYGVHELDEEAMLVVVVEGEKARDALADALADTEVSVVGTVTGAGQTPAPEVLEDLRGHEVVLWPDTDGPGVAHMERVAANLQGIAALVRVFTWHDAPVVMVDGKLKGQDAADHPATVRGDEKAVGKLLTDLCSAPEYSPPTNVTFLGEARSKKVSKTKHASSFNLTDLGNAERFAALHGEDVRHVREWGRWFVYDDTRWTPDRTGAVERKAKLVVRSIDREAADAERDDERKDLRSHASRSESKRSLQAMIDLAQSEEGIPACPEDLDPDPWLLNVKNGTLDLRTGKLREHRREDLITKLAPVEYNAKAKAPTWETFLERVLPSEALRTFVQRAVGYSLTGDNRERVLLILYGMGRNGKSTFLEAIREMLGAEDGYAMKTPAETLMAKPAGGIPNDIARLKGARFVSSSETEAGRRLAEALVKEITGNDTISARFMRAEWFDFKPTHKVWLATNHKPEIRGTDPAIWDRIRLVPFSVRIPDNEVDTKLPEKLKEELPGILRWAVEGCLGWQNEGLGEPKEVKVATEAYRSEMDTLAAFIAERCVVNDNASATARCLYDAYTSWCDENREDAEKQRSFGSRLKERGFQAARDKSGSKRIWKGIGLADDRYPPDGQDEKTSDTSDTLTHLDMNSGITPHEGYTSRSCGKQGQNTSEGFNTSETASPNDLADEYEEMVEERARDVAAALDDGQWRDIL